MTGSTDHLLPVESGMSRRQRASRAVNRFGLMLIVPALVAAAVVPALASTLGGGGAVLRAVLPLSIGGGALAAVVAALAALASRWIAARKPARRLVAAIRIAGRVTAGVLGLASGVLPVATVVGEGTGGAGVANATFVLLLLTWMGVLVLSESIARISPPDPR